MIDIKIPAKIKLKDITFDLKDKDKKDQFIESFNYVPLLYIFKLKDTVNSDLDLGNTIDPKDVIYVKLYNNKFLPEIELYCNDTIGNLFSDLYPFDHDVILSIFVKSNSNLLFPIRMDFRITEFETTKSNSDNYVLKYLIRGILDVDNLHYTRYEVKKGTSYNILKDIAISMNLGWASNIDNSNDEMKWINPSETYMDFIRATTKRAYIDRNSFVWTFIDFQYNLTYVNVELELNNQNIIEKQIFTNPTIIKNDEELSVQLYLTNNPAFHMTNKYIDKFDLINQSVKLNLDKGYRMKSTWYEKNQNKTYREYLNDLETKDDNIKPLYDYQSPIFNENINDDYYIGKVESDNVHENYAISKPINEFNLQKLEKMKMVVTLNQVNFSIKRFQNILVEIYNVNDLFSKKAGEKNAIENINEHLSGYWLVTGINYLFKRVGGVQQEITLVRRDLTNEYSDRHDLRKLNELNSTNTA